MWRPSRALIVLLAAWVTVGCAGTTAPPRFLRNAEASQQQSYGGWIDVTYAIGTGSSRVAGELIAVSADSLWIKHAGGGTIVPTQAVTGGQLAGYDSQWRRVEALAVLGALTTISNGAFLIVTAPAWVIGGSLAAASQSRIPLRSLPPARWTDLASFARFPQGMPAPVTLQGLSPVPR
jgi:hypothetical protein